MNMPRLPFRELRRRPSRFVVATVVLSFLATLLLFLGGLLDGLYLGSTGAIRAQDADAIVFSSEARESFLRSRVAGELRAQVEGAEGVDEVGGIGPHPNATRYPPLTGPTVVIVPVTAAAPSGAARTSSVCSKAWRSWPRACSTGPTTTRPSCRTPCWNCCARTCWPRCRR